MYRFNTIVSDNAEVELVCMYSRKTGLPVDVFIDFKTIMDKEYTTQTLSWDNDDFIFGKFYKFLKRWDNRNLKKKDEENFKDIWPILTDEFVWEMIEMLDLAIIEGWYERKTE